LQARGSRINLAGAAIAALLAKQPAAAGAPREAAAAAMVSNARCSKPLAVNVVAWQRFRFSHAAISRSTAATVSHPDQVTAKFSSAERNV